MATYSTEIDSTWEQEEVFEYLSTFSNAREWDPGVADGESTEPGPRRCGFGVPARRADRRAGSCRSTTGWSISTAPAGWSSRRGAPGSSRRTPSRWSAIGSRLPGPLRGSARGAGRAAPGGASHRPGLRPHGRPGGRRVAPARWRDTGAARPCGGHRARGERRRQLQPGRLSRARPPRAMAAAVRPHGPYRRRDGRLVGDRPGGRTRAGAPRRLGVARRPEQEAHRGGRLGCPRRRGGPASRRPSSTSSMPMRCDAFAAHVATATRAARTVWSTRRVRSSRRYRRRARRRRADAWPPRCWRPSA